MDSRSMMNMSSPRVAQRAGSPTGNAPSFPRTHSPLASPRSSLPMSPLARQGSMMLPPMVSPTRHASGSLSAIPCRISQGKGLNGAQDDLLSSMTSLITPMLVDTENRLIAHMNTCFQQQQQTLQQVAAAQQHQRSTTEKQERSLQQLSAVHSKYEAIAKQTNENQSVFSAKHERTLQQLVAAQRQLQATFGINKITEDQNKALESLQTGRPYRKNLPDSVDSPPQEQKKAMESVQQGRPCRRNLKDIDFMPQEQYDESSQEKSDEIWFGHALTTGSASKDTKDTPLLNRLKTVHHHLHPELKALSKRSIEHRMAALFPKVDDLKKTVVDSLRKIHFEVDNYYHEEGVFSEIARSSSFKNSIMLVILLSTIWMAVETDYNKETILCKAPLQFQIVDNIFCSIFTFEIFVRFMAFSSKSFALEDKWFLFDLGLVVLMVWETWIMVILYWTTRFEFAGSAARGSQILRMLRLTRLVRVARATRLLKYSPELLTLAWSVIAGARSVVVVLAMVWLLIYVFAIIFTMGLSGVLTNYRFDSVFDTVPQSMNSLLLQVLCGPDVELMKTLYEYSLVFYIVFLIFILCSNLTLMNMLIGILCDIVSGVARDTKEELFIKEVESHIARLAHELDIDQNGKISKWEFDQLIDDPLMTASFEDLGVDVVGVANFARFIYEQCDEIPYLDFGRLVGEFRGTKHATVKDIMELRRYMTMELLSFESRVGGT